MSMGLAGVPDMLLWWLESEVLRVGESLQRTGR